MSNCPTCGFDRSQLDNVEDEIAKGIQLASRGEALVRELAALAEDLQGSFDLRYKADQRAIKRWQEATGKKFILPDHADLCVWLLEQLEAKGGL